jgi:PIN domain nuclease of toxin-antitoxin system
MNGYLLDTHTFLWILFETKALSQNVRNIVESEENQIFVSSVTFWEIAIKVSLGKLSLFGCQPHDLPELSTKMGFSNLSLSPLEAANSFRLPRLAHKDPFDRMLIWQAISNQYCLISYDTAFSAYEMHGLIRIW